MKKWMLGGFLGILVVLLASCGQLKLTTTKTSYAADEMVAVVKGNATKKATLTYKVAGQAQQKTANNSGTFVISVPVTDKKQTVKIKAKTTGNSVTKTVQVQAAKPLGSYLQISQIYNAVSMQTGQIAGTLPTTPKVGMQNLVTLKDATLRGNVANDQVMGLTIIVPMKVLKDKAAQKVFGTIVSVTAASVGADAKSVMKQFAQRIKEQKDGQTTTIKTIHSKGVNFNIGVSTAKLYIYVTK